MLAIRVLGAVAIVLAALVSTAASARAHSDLDETRPAMDAVLETPPDAIELLFNIEVADRGMRLALRDGTGNPVPVAAPVRTSETTVRADVIGPVPAGPLRVRWSVIAADGHRVSGNYAFVVEQATVSDGATGDDGAGVGTQMPTEQDAANVAEATPLAEPSRAAEWGAAGLRAVGYAALLLLIGAVVLRFAVMPGAARALPDPGAVYGLRVTVRAAVAAALALVLVTSLMLIPVQARADALTIGEFLDIRAGRVALLTVVLAIVTAAAFAVFARSARSLAVRVLGLALVVALSLTPVLTGHSATASTPVALVDWVHVLAAGAWGGGVLTLAVFAGRFVRRIPSADRGPAVTVIIHGFTRVALVGLGLLVVSGAVTAVVMVGSPLNLLDSTWGLVLIAKVATVIIAVLLAGLARRGTSFAVGVRIEAGVMLVAIVLTGVLTGLNP